MKPKITTVLLFCLIFLACVNTNTQQTVSYTGLGGVHSVDGSLHILSIGNNDYVIDIGIFYGGDAVNYPLPRQLDVKRIKAVIITHAHADHVGRLPLLFEKGYTGPVYMTPVTYDIARISLLSSIRYADHGVETFYYSRNNRSERKPVYLDRFHYGDYQTTNENKLYIRAKRSELNERGFYMAQTLVQYLESELIQKLERQTRKVDFNQPVTIGDLTFEFLPTSHLPGSAMVKTSVANSKILFSGDVGSDRNPFLNKNERINENFNIVFVEGTYSVSGNESLDRRELYAADRMAFREYVGQAIRNGDRVIIPAFVVDRTQQVLYEIKQGIDQGLIPRNTKVKAYSPTSEKITDLYTHYSRNRSMYAGYFSENMFGRLFAIPNLEYNPSGFEVNYGEIAVMSSGMMSHAYSREALIRYAADSKSHFVIVGYQDPDELGGQLLSSQGRMMVDDRELAVNARVFRSTAFSGHADIYQIQSLISTTNPQRIFLVHLDPKNAAALRNHYQSKFPSAEVIVPELGKRITLFSY